MVPERRSEPYVTRVMQENPLLAGKTRIAVPRLEITIEREGGNDVVRSHVHSGDACRIGSHRSNDVVLDDPTISRFHCCVSYTDDRWRVVDSGSKNGTRLDGVRVLAAEIDRESLLLVGESILRLRPIAHVDSLRPAATAFGALVGKSAAMQQLFAVLERVGASDIDVLIRGESGTGKELVATELVQRSERANGPLVVVDCGSISPSLVESELFGHVRGAFTGADRDREGAFESANGGTVFLDEIGELPLELQPKLLRALEAREVRRLGKSRATPIDVRVIAATHRDLEREVNRGRFREDLYYRLAKMTVRVPSLRDRVEDIPLLVQSFIAAAGRPAGRLLTPSVITEMQQHDWPGNVRELKNHVERCLVLSDIPPPAAGKSGMRKAVKVPSVAPPAPTEPDLSVPFRVAKEAVVQAFERAYIGPLIEKTRGNMSKAARMARMDRMYLHQLAQKYGFKTGRGD